MWFIGYSNTKMTGLAAEQINGEFEEEVLSTLLVQVELCCVLIKRKLAMEGALAFTQILLGEGPPLEDYFKRVVIHPINIFNI